MSDGTHIEWTDATWNPITGCSVTSPGCRNCYAMKLAGGRLRHHPSRAGLTQPSSTGPVWTGELRLNEDWLQQPLAWTRPRRIFVCAHGDLFHEAAPDAWIDRVFAVMALAKHHTFQVLTKRAKRMREYLSAPGRAQAIGLHVAQLLGLTGQSAAMVEPPTLPLPNVWGGVSVEDQQRADERIPELLATPLAVRWLSAEPLLGPVDLERPRPGPDLDQGGGRYICQPWVIQSGIDWVVVGGESGPRARPMHPDWARSLRDQCKAAGVPFLFKQWGSWRAASWFDGPDADADAGDGFVDLDRVEHIFVANDGRTWDTNGGRHMYPPLPLGHWCLMVNEGKQAAGRLLDGVLHDAYPRAAA